MNRIDRLTAILIQLQSKRIVTGREIADRFSISLRTVYRDIRALEDAGVPIGAEAGLGYFLAEGYHLPPVMFTPEEAGALLLGGKLIQQFSDQGADRHFATAMDKIKSVLGDTDQDYINRLDALVMVLNAAPRPGDGLAQNLLMDIQQVLAGHKKVSIQYHSAYKDEATSRVIEPLGLCFYAGHWHLLAYCHLRKDYRDFRVDRVRGIRHTGECFDRDRHGKLEKLVRQIVMPAELKPATVLFSHQAAQFIRDQKFYFGFAQQRERKNGVEMQFLVPDYDYLVHWLMSFIDQVTIISPLALKQTMRKHVHRLAAHYA
jgi:predicted DNA-binding transcriptional regulator YafY